MRIKKIMIFLGFILVLSAAGQGSAQDSTLVATPPADSLTAVADSAVSAPLTGSLSAVQPDSSQIAAPDSLAGERSDSLEQGLEAPVEMPGTSRDSLPATRRPVRTARESVLARVIPWDWDEFTNVIEVGLKNLRDSSEYSLTRNEIYDSLFVRYQGKVVRVRGQVSRDTDGFLKMTVNAIVPPDTAAAKAGGTGNP